MKNSEKFELRKIVLGIPQYEIETKSITKLWKKYAPDSCYGTFRKYLKWHGKRAETK